jgi:hydroxypyruvate reductase
MIKNDSNVLLSAGTDGASHLAGAIVDPATLCRSAVCGLDPLSCLRQAVSGRYLETSGNVLISCPAGTNVTDMVAGLELAGDPCG